MERNVLEYVDHLHEHFLYPCSINERGRYNVPNNPVEGYRLRLHAETSGDSCSLYFFLSIASRCTSQASQSMGGRMGHTGQKQRQRQRRNDMEAGGSLSLRVEEALVVRKTGNYVAYISARVLYVHIQSTSRSGVEEARPRKETNLEVINGRPGFPATLHPHCMFNKRR
jgi:hypothetical protein